MQASFRWCRAALVSLVLGLSLAACGGGGSGGDTTSPDISTNPGTSSSSGSTSSSSGSTSSSSGSTSSSGGTISATGRILISGNKIYDKAGNQIVARGPECVVAVPHYVDHLDAIAATGANAVRIMMTIDAANGMTPADFDAIFARAVQHRMLIFAGIYTWDNDRNNPVSAALGGGNFYELTAPEGTNACSRTAANSCYLAMWDRQWMRDLMEKYRANVIIDGSQEYVSSPGVDAGTEAGQLEWANAAKMNIAWFRRAGYTHPLTIMSNFEGRDLAAIVRHGDDIRSVDTVVINGNPQTMFAWQAYWSGTWYPSWQGYMILGPDQTLSATQAIHQVLPTLSFPVEAGFDNYPGDTGMQYPDQINQAAVDGQTWLWWVWDTNVGHVECRMADPDSGPSCVDIVQNSTSGFAGATPLSP